MSVGPSSPGSITAFARRVGKWERKGNQLVLKNKMSQGFVAWKDKEKWTNIKYLTSLNTKYGESGCSIGYVLSPYSVSSPEPSTLFPLDQRPSHRVHVTIATSETP